MLKPAVSLTMARHVGSDFVSNRQGRWGPNFTRGFIADVDGFTGGITDGVVGPGRQLVFPAIEGPSVTRTRFRNEKTKRRIGNHIDPWRGSAQTLAEDGHILAPLIRKATQAIEKFERRLPEWHVQPFGRGRRAPTRSWYGLGALRSRNLLGQRAAPTEQYGSCDRLQKGSFARRNQLGPKEEDATPQLAGVGRKPQTAAAHEVVQNGLQILGIRRRFFIDDDEVRGDLLHAPVFMGAQQLSDDFDIFGLVNAHEHDGYVTGDSLGPQRGLLQRGET